MVAGGSSAAQFAQEITKFLAQSEYIKSSGVTLWPDPLAAAVALSPEIVMDYEARCIAVETGHNLARGQTIVDYLPRSRQPANIQIIRTINSQEFQKLLQIAVQFSYQ